MVRGRTVIVIALLLIVPAVAGCIGGSSDTDNADQDTTDQPPDPDSQDSGDQDGADDSGDDDSGDDDGDSGDSDDDGSSEDETPEAKRESFTNETTIVAQGSVIFNTPAVPIDSEAVFTLFQNPPEGLTGLLVEATVETPTAGTQIGQVELEIRADNGEARDSQSTVEQPARVNLTGDEYTDNEAVVEVSPPRFPTLWANAQVTVYTTYWTGGPPDWEYSAVS